MSESMVRIAAVSIDCDDHIELARFYAELLGGEIMWSTAKAAAVRSGHWVLIPQKVEGYRPPSWPGSSILHLDLNGDAAVAELVAVALAAGAHLAEDQPDPRWIVLLDPAGHPFCITPFSPQK
jgi:Glyoxalase-like domain